jgi:hypothetical protein
MLLDVRTSSYSKTAFEKDEKRDESINMFLSKDIDISIHVYIARGIPFFEIFPNWATDRRVRVVACCMGSSSQ